ncbi:MAG TPA: DUF1549 and DUF1553 domain-containing protein [Tepidisphaeraceae bacterium]|nr:DUF1549 and DUF1553 domain-containing protein [Tepidisphaeraceae bacterium]
MFRCVFLNLLVICASALPLAAAMRPLPKPKGKQADLWVMKPVVRPPIPAGLTDSTNPIDAFIAAQYKAHGLTPVGLADKGTLLRRVYLDLIGIPPTVAEQEAFAADNSPDAYQKVVDHLLASEQHGVRYARHWLDVLRYADADERMIAAPGIYLWRDWVIKALNEDLPYDQFVRAQLTGYRSTVRTQMSATGFRSRIEPRPDDMFALGFLARGDVARDGKNAGELQIAAVETVSTAFMGLTVGCAKCHDHMYDPIKKRDFYAMKALFDPLVLKKVVLATPAEIFASGQALDKAEKQRAPIQAQLGELIAPYKNKLYEDRVAMLPRDVQAVIRKPEQERSAAEKKIADDYFPVLRIDGDKLTQIMPPAVRRKYEQLQGKLRATDDARRSAFLPAFWTVQVDPAKALQKSYILTSGDAERPELNHPVEPSWPFAPAKIDFDENRVEAFSDWLTAPRNPLFARVAVNRIWQWHFGQGLQKTSSDFGNLGGAPSNPQLLDWLASEFVNGHFSMKQLHRLIVTSRTYQLASQADGETFASDIKTDSDDTFLWHFRLQRLEAEPIWDSIFSDAGDLDLSVGGRSFDVNDRAGRGRGRRGMGTMQANPASRRRAAYFVRGFSSSRDVMPTFLQAYDVDDGRAPCPLRTQTVTAPQALFMMNSNQVEQASADFAKLLRKQAGSDLTGAVKLAYETALSRPPSSTELEHALHYLDNDPARLKGFAWLMLNLDEFTYVR